MKIWVDADACPKVIRETLIRAAERTGVECTFVANHLIPLPKRDNIRALQVSSGFDIADNEIVRRTEAGDLVITADIPLADEVISKGGLALNPRGELYTKETIKARLNIRDLWIPCAPAAFKPVALPPFRRPNGASLPIIWTEFWLSALGNEIF